jgi:putative acetyltransferase
VRTPDNPGFYFGNFLILDRPPADLREWLQTFENSFEPWIRHRCLSWAGDPLSAEQEREARGLQLVSDGTVEMALTAESLRLASGVPSAHSSDEEWTIRRLDVSRDWAASAALATACDTAISEASENYRLFTERLQAARKKWLERDLATWWGVFAGDELVGQCGVVVCGDVGRYQAVETHPKWRRKGICHALISAVARDAFERFQLPRLVLAAELDGPALALYSRIGFQETGRTHSLMRHPNPMHVRDEQIGDRAGVRSLVNAAFGTDEESSLIERLRDSAGVISLIAEQSNSTLGHILFSKLGIDGPGSGRSAVALAPLAVRPAAQGRGVGSLLVHQGIERCKQAGHELCVVVGSPGYYGRFGFVPAVPHGLTNSFGFPDENFMVLELVPGTLADCAGEVVYERAFSELS